MLVIIRANEDNTNRAAYWAEATYHLNQEQPITTRKPSQDRPSSKNFFQRTWTTSDGKFSVKAELISFDGTKVELKTEHGKVVTIELNRLSKTDREFVEKSS